MGFEKIVVPCEKDIIIQQFEAKIISGELAPDTKLPTERELADQFGVTKSVVHFALKELEQLKFIKCVPRHGTYINDWLKYGNFETLNAALKLQGVNVEPRLKDSLIVLRNTIESDAMARCGQYCSAEDYAEMEKTIDELEASPLSAGAEAHAKLIMQFHYLVIQKSGNLIYPIVMNAFMDFALLIWVHCVEYWTKDRIVIYEREQLRLIKEGKGEVAGELIKKMYATFLEDNRME